jgi:sugar lactone lactonase YvrE
MMGATKRPSRRVVGSGLLLALLLGGSAACRQPGPPCPGPPGATSTSTPTTRAPAPTGRCPLADQTPPKGTNGVVYRNGELWIADLTGGQLIVVDPASGAIVARYGAEAGITGQPDDLAIAADGTVYWTGFDSGIVGRMRPGQKSTTLATIAPGVNPIAFGPDGQLYVGRALTGDGLYRVDPASGQVTSIAPTLGNVNAFAFGRDGQLYAPNMAGTGSLVRIDPRSGAMATLAENLGQVDAVRFRLNRLGTKDYTTAYVLVAYPAKVWTVNLGTGAATAFKETLPNPIGDNMAFAPDGRLFVTAYNRPSISVIAPDGTVSTLAVGRA